MNNFFYIIIALIFILGLIHQFYPQIVRHFRAKRWQIVKEGYLKATLTHKNQFVKQMLLEYLNGKSCEEFFLNYGEEHFHQNMIDVTNLIIEESRREQILEDIKMIGIQLKFLAAIKHIYDQDQPKNNRETPGV